MGIKFREELLDQRYSEIETSKSACVLNELLELIEAYFVEVLGSHFEGVLHRVELF